MNDPAELPLDTVVLVGGRSTRMGTDKATLIHPLTRQPLLARQLELAASLNPGTRFVSAAVGQTLPPLPPEVQRVEDEGTLGPLAGIIAALTASSHGHLAVIPVDLPMITPDIYRALIEQVDAPGKGAFAESPRGPEPLVSVLPRTLLPELRRFAGAGRFSPRQLFSRELKHLVHPISFADPELFLNWNRPGDVGELKPPEPPST